jgi:hypothetical protein
LKGTTLHTETTIYRDALDPSRRTAHFYKLFGAARSLRFESIIFDVGRSLSVDYRGGLWEFYSLSNRGFYLAPQLLGMFATASENGYRGQMSADALGITSTLYAYSHLSISHDENHAATYARHYHLLLDYAFKHDEGKTILKAID